MTRARTAAVAVALLLTLAACSSDTKPVAAPTSAATPSSAAPATSAAVDDRAMCRKNADTGNAFNFDPAVNLANGLLAAQSGNPGIAKAGGDLVAAATAGQTGSDTAGANVDIMKAQIDVAEACASLFGDGPW